MTKKCTYVNPKINIDNIDSNSARLSFGGKKNNIRI